MLSLGAYLKFVLFGGSLSLLVAVGAVLQPESNSSNERESAFRDFQDGNFNDAYQRLRKLCLAGSSSDDGSARDLQAAVQCLQRLGRQNEIDELLEKTVAAHHGNGIRPGLPVERSVPEVQAHLLGHVHESMHGL